MRRDDKMQLALLHFDLSSGPTARNMEMICQGIRIAAKHQAKWIITPEMALQGYFFTQMNRSPEIGKAMRSSIQPILDLARELGVFVFLGGAEYDVAVDENYNSCLVIDNTGQIIGRHDKVKVVHSKTEAWSSPGRKLTCVDCDSISIGLLVCADAWFGENGEELGKMGAAAIIVIAAWPPGCGGPPESAWERCSKRSGGLPLVVCNQTGNTNGLDCTIAKSAIVIDGVLQMQYEGETAILFAELDFDENKVRTQEFKVLKGAELGVVLV